MTLTEFEASGIGVMSGPAKMSGGGGTFPLGRASGRWTLLIIIAAILFEQIPMPPFLALGKIGTEERVVVVHVIHCRR